MIQLYELENTDFSMNGDYVLEPIRADLRLVLNGEWTLELEVPQDDAQIWQKLQHGSVIRIEIPRYGRQLYVAQNPRRTDFNSVSCTAYPIAMWDARNELICLDCRPTNLTGHDALQYILDGCAGSGKYEVFSDIAKVSTAYYIQKNFMECIASDAENSFVNRWGGEIIYDNYHITINEEAGEDNGLRISASRNLSGFEVSEDDADYVSQIIPVGFNGRCYGQTITREQTDRVLHKRFVTYDRIKLAEDAQDSDTQDDSIQICQTEEDMKAALEAAAQKSFTDGEFLPSFTYSIDYVDLRHTGEYARFSQLDDLWLGDIVYVENLDRHLETRQKVIELTYDLTRDEITGITLGARPKDFFNLTSAATARIGECLAETETGPTLMGEKVRGIIDMMETSMRAQKNVANRADTRAILFEDLDQSSPTFGALCIGTQGLQISKQRNASGSDWVWTTAINYQSVIADAIITGILTGKEGNFWLNLDTGDFYLGDGTFAGTINVKDGYIKGGQATVGDESCSLGFWMNLTTGQFVLGSGIFRGTIQVTNGIITGKDQNFVLNLDTGEFVLGDGIFKGTISTEKDAQIGRRLYVSSAESGSVWSGLYLGNATTAENNPRLGLNAYTNKAGTRTRQAQLLPGASSDAYVSVMDAGTSSYVSAGAKKVTLTGTDAAEITSPQVTISPNGVSQTDRIYLKSGSGAGAQIHTSGSLSIKAGSIVVSDGKTTKAGITYKGKVDEIEVMMGVVVGAKG